MRRVVMSRALLLSIFAATSALAQAVKTGDHVGTLRFADMKGEKVALDRPGVLYVVDLWALGCKPCIQEIPALDRLAAEYEPGGQVRVIGVLWGDWKKSDLKKVPKAVGSSRPIFGDPEGWFNRFEIRSFPTKLFIRDGVIVRITRGGPLNATDAYDDLKAQIESELHPTPAKWE